jgi:hypothetical protein
VKESYSYCSFPLFKIRGLEQMSEPTGPTGSTEMIDSSEQYKVPSIEILWMFPSAFTGPVQSPYIATLDELLTSYESTVAQEALDRSALSILTNPSRESFRPQLFQWAAAGFPSAYIIQSISVNPPNICSDGVTRNVGKYVEFCIGTDMGSVIQSLTSLMTGIQPTWSTLGNTIRIHVTRA